VAAKLTVRSFLALMMAFAILVLGAGVALADDLVNDVVSGASGKVEEVSQGGSTTVAFWLVPTGTSAGDPRTGCNATGSANAFLSPGVLPTGVTATPSPAVLQGCDSTSSVSIVFSASATAVPGNYVITPSVAGGRATSVYNNTGGQFTLKIVTSNTAPDVSVTGVVHGASYEYGGVPTPGCSVSDAEDSGESATPTSSAITGTNASFGLGSQSVTCSYTDGGGLTDSATATYSIVDTQDPVVTVPGDVIVEATSLDSTFATWTAPSATDNVPQTLDVTCDAVSGASFPLGSSHISCSATDVSGNTGSNSFFVIAQDTTAPEVTAPDNIVEEATSAAGAVVSWDPATATDLIHGPTDATCDATSGDTFPLGVTTVTCSATDLSDNLGTDTFTITVQDTTGPIFSPLGNITEEATGPSGATASWDPISALDAVDGPVEATCEPGSGSIFALGVTTVECTAVDAADNENTAGFSVTVEDTTGPELSLPATITEEATGPDGAMVGYTATASDLVDGPVSPDCTPASGATFDLGTTTVNCSATDDAGNTSNGSFTVTVEDTTPPEIDVPDNMTIEAEGPTGAVANFTATASDLVDGDLDVDCVPPSGSVFALGTTTVECSASDAHGNPASESFTVTVEDTTPPDLTLPDDIIEEATGPAGAVVNYTASASDLVDGSIIPACLPLSGSTFPLGTTEVECSATDLAGNEATGSFDVTVRDTTAPAFTVPGGQIKEATGHSGAVAAWDPITATDAVDGTLDVPCDWDSGDTFPLGETTVQCSVTDDANNESTGSFLITVVDTTAPSVDDVINITVEATGPTGAVSTWLTPAATDIVDGPVDVMCDATSGATFPLGVTSVTCSATDAALNTGSSDFTITVQDTTAPLFGTLADITEEATGPSGATTTWDDIFADDIVDGLIEATCDHASGETFPLGTTLVTCSATDVALNTNTAGFNVTVQDTTGPALTLPADITAEATGPSGAVVSYTAGATDSVDGPVDIICEPASGTTFALGTTPVNCSAEDETGNMSAGSFNVTVEDTTAPTLNLPADKFAFANSSAGSAVSYTATASDLVDGPVTPSCSPASGSVFPLGETTVECSATDGASNTSTGSFTVTVEYERDGGILQPINADASSIFSRGRAVPVKFRLKRDAPNGFLTQGWLIQRVRVNCASLAEDAEPETVASNTPSVHFRYDAGADQYIFNASFQDKSAGTCWKIQIDLGDGSVPLTSAVFKLQK
jgi:large repetitive protein